MPAYNGIYFEDTIDTDDSDSTTMMIELTNNQGSYDNNLYIVVS